jgi:hypothetical protein
MVHDNPSSEVWRSLPLDQTEAFYLCKQSRLNHKLDPHPIFQHDNLSKIGPLWSLVPKGEKMLFTKIELKGGEAQRGRKILFTKIDSKGWENLKERIDKRRGSTKISSTQVGGASSSYVWCIVMYFFFSDTLLVWWLASIIWMMHWGTSMNRK